MSTATVMQNAQFRKELLDKLLCKKVTFQDVKMHGLSQQEMDYLHLNDILSRREYIRLVRKGGYSKQATYNKWRRVVKESVKEFDPKPYSNIIIALKRSGDDTSVLEMWLKSRCNGGIPAKEILTVKDYVVDFLGGVRDDLYADTLSTCEAAKKLGMSRRHIQRLAKEGNQQKKNRGLISENRVADYQKKKKRHLEQQAIRKNSSCIDAAKKLIKNKVEFTGELRESYEKLRVFLDILFEPTFDRKRHNPRNVALSPLLTESDMIMKCRLESIID